MKKPGKHYCQPHYYCQILTLFSKLHKNGKKAIGIFFPLHHSGTFKGWFSSVLFLWKNISSKKMLGRVLVKNSSFLRPFIEEKRLIFVTLFQVHTIPMVKISQTKKNRALYHACVLKYDAAKIHYFFKNGLYFGRPLYIAEKRKPLSKLAFYDKIFIKFKLHTI